MRRLAAVLLVTGCMQQAIPVAIDAGTAPSTGVNRSAALQAFIAEMKRVNMWGSAVTRAEVSSDTLIVTVTSTLEMQPKRVRLAFAKSLANAWEHLDKAPGAQPSLRLEDLRGQKIGGSTWLGEIEVDDD